VKGRAPRAPQGRPRGVGRRRGQSRCSLPELVVAKTGLVQVEASPPSAPARSTRQSALITVGFTRLLRAGDQRQRGSVEPNLGSGAPTTRPAPCRSRGSTPSGRFVAAAYERRSLAVASHWPFEQWDHFLPNDTTAVSLLDSLIHHSIVVVTDGESFRTPEARQRGGEHKLRAG